MSTIFLDVRSDGVAVLTFDQPGSKINVLTDQVWAEFEAAIDSLAPRTDVRGLVLASAKPDIFIAGADLKLLGDAAGPGDPAVRAFIDRGNRTLFQLEALPFPTCAVVDGATLGGGCEVSLACDARISGTSPKVALGLPEVNLGLVPGWGGSQRLPRLIGVPNALAAMHAGEPVPVKQWATRTVPSDQLVAAAIGHLSGFDWKAARRVRQSALPAAGRMNADFYENVREAVPQMPGKSVAARLAALELVYRGGPLPLADAVRLETESFLQLAGSAESKRRIADFFVSRKK
jgi:enoyl-CoA hydratase/carnithine racemase